MTSNPYFFPLGLAVVGLPHLDSTFPRGLCTVVVDASCQAHLTQAPLPPPPPWTYPLTSPPPPH